MVWEYQCPTNGCEFVTQRNEEPDLIEDAQQHMRDKHGESATRDDVEQYVLGPG